MEGWDWDSGRHCPLIPEFDDFDQLPGSYWKFQILFESTRGAVVLSFKKTTYRVSQGDGQICRSKLNSCIWIV